ncbi:hypothetical protein IRZ54_04825 [Staphylococcus aureus]|nr:hypothetical protein [Staphylococcus aureus]QOY78899.1 hypothetical protein IRZ54_04825 [Staphylococcus aureus]
MKLGRRLHKGWQNLYKMGMYISPYSPIILMIFINNMESISLNSFLKTFYDNDLFWTIIFITIGFSLIISSDFLERLKKSTSNNTRPINIELTTLKINESEIINYFITYLIPILTLNPTKWTSIISNMILILLVGIYFIKNNMLSFNILFLVINYRIYKGSRDNIYIRR